MSDWLISIAGTDTGGFEGILDDIGDHADGMFEDLATLHAYRTDRLGA